MTVCVVYSHSPLCLSSLLQTCDMFILDYSQIMKVSIVSHCLAGLSASLAVCACWEDSAVYPTPANAQFSSTFPLTEADNSASVMKTLGLLFQ